MESGAILQVWPLLHCPHTISLTVQLQRCHWQGDVEVAAADRRRREVNTALSSIISHIDFQVETHCRRRCCGEQHLPFPHSRKCQGYHHRAGGKRELSSLESIQHRIQLLVPQQEAPSSYHDNNACLHGYIAFLIVIHP